MSKRKMWKDADVSLLKSLRNLDGENPYELKMN